MANTLTAIIPTLYEARDRVSRELVGMIPAVSRDADVSRVAVGASVTVPVVPAATGGNITPGSVPPDDGDVIVGSRSLTITKSKYSPVRWSGEEQLAVGPSGVYNKVLADQFVQAMRWLTNQVEADLIAAGVNAASRAYGTAGTAPFGTAGDLTDFAGINRIFDENGTALQGRQLVLNSGARFNLEGKQSVLFKANEAGSDAFLRRRVLASVMGMDMFVSGQFTQHVAGAGTGYDFGAAGEAVGQTVLTLEGGTVNTTGIKAGDIVTFAGDTNKYVVGTGLVATSGDITINDPGLRIAGTDTTEMTIGGSYTPSLAFTPNAIILAARAPAAPTIGDSADDVTFIQDPVSGIVFEVRLYREYRRVRFEVGLAWGVGIVKEEDIAILLG